MASQSAQTHAAGKMPSLVEMVRLTGSTNHYMVLGLRRTADEAMIKNAYFARVRHFHPDRARVNGWEAHPEKLQMIVSALTESYEILSKPHRRAEFDAYLADRTSGLGARTSVPPHEGPRTDPTGLRGKFSVPPESNVRVTGQRRVQQQARNFGDRTNAAHAPLRTSEAPVASQSYRKSANFPGDAHLSENRFVAMAMQAAADGQWASAVNTAKLALELEPEKVELVELLKKIQLEADKALADKFLNQARYEEESREYSRAARSYERAANGKNSPELYARAARCLMRGDDNRKAVDMARKAVILDQSAIEYRLLLARAYQGVEMFKSAHAEAKRALLLDRKSVEAKLLLKKLKRTGL